MGKVRFGIVGLGRGRDVLAICQQSFSEKVTVTAVCEESDEVLEREKDKITEDIQVFHNYDEFLASGLVDAVFLANYFPDHAEYAIKAMEKGIAVLSETTAAPSLGLCVDLVEAKERTNGKYMLAVNCIYQPATHVMKTLIKNQTYGKVLHGNGEYVHGGPHPLIYGIDMDNLHWRQTMPITYYNMHSLGPMMYISESLPVKVMCKPTRNPEKCKKNLVVSDCPTSMVITEMDNGAVFNTTGCNTNFPCDRWYRISCEEGTMETVRYSGYKDLLVAEGHCEKMSTTRYDLVTSGIIDPDDADISEDAAKSTHGGADYFIMHYFLKYLKGEHEPFFDVYRSAVLSATGILAWYSALTDGKEYPIPDFHKKEDRDKVRDDYRTPFAKSYKDLTLPCRLDEKEKFEGCNL